MLNVEHPRISDMVLPSSTDGSGSESNREEFFFFKVAQSDKGPERNKQDA